MVFVGVMNNECGFFTEFQLELLLKKCNNLIVRRMRIIFQEFRKNLVGKKLCIHHIL